MSAETKTPISSLPKTVGEDALSIRIFEAGDVDAKISAVTEALRATGIVGVRGFAGYEAACTRCFDEARRFFAQDDRKKSEMAPVPGGVDICGYERGAEQFRDERSGEWRADSDKTSYYAMLPDRARHNKWPTTKESTARFRDAYMNLARLVRAHSVALLKSLALFPICDDRNGEVDGDVSVGDVSVGDDDANTLQGFARMLHYCARGSLLSEDGRSIERGDTKSTQPLWCGAHLDHGMFTALVPARYFAAAAADAVASDESLPSETQIDEPAGAGLYVAVDESTATDDAAEKTRRRTETWLHAPSDDASVLYFQVGEVGQLLSDDRISATKHLVRRPLVVAPGVVVNRYSFAFFLTPPLAYAMESRSKLCADARWRSGVSPTSGGAVTFAHWHAESVRRYKVAAAEPSDAGHATIGDNSNRDSERSKPAES